MRWRGWPETRRDWKLKKTRVRPGPGESLRRSGRPCRILRVPHIIRSSAHAADARKHFSCEQDDDQPDGHGFHIGVALAAPVMGRIADRVGRKRVIVLSAATLGIATLLTATSAGLGALLFWRFMQGVATPGVFSVTTAYVHDEWPAGRAASAISAYVSGTIVGGFSGRAIAGFTAEHLGWRWAFWRLAASAC